MLRKVRDLFTRNRVLSFNQARRDQWVAAQAREIAPGSLVLDVGAGSCPYRKLFQHCVYRTQDATPLAATQLRGKSGYGAIDYYCDATNIPVENGSFDAVLCTEVLEHVPEPIRVVEEFARILKPGGKLILSAPLGSWLHQEPFHFYGGYTEYWYRRMLPAAGFAEPLVEPNAGFFSAFGQEAIRFAFLSRPWAARLPVLLRALWLMPWLAIAPFFVFVMPFLGYWFDRLVQLPGFTVGYFVTAIRSGNSVYDPAK